jgi:hypothetical protein
MPKTARLYAITFTIKYPAYNERGAHVWWMFADTAAKAAKDARRQWKDLGNDSPIVVSSVKLAATGVEPTTFR